MVKDKEIQFDDYEGRPRLFRLPTTIYLKETKLKHEMLCSQLYVLLETTGKQTVWQVPKGKAELIADRQSVYNDNVILWEIDRSTEDYPDIRSKVRRYLDLAKRLADTADDPKEAWFYVCFTTIDQYDKFGNLKWSAAKRVQGIFTIFHEEGMMKQCLVSTNDVAMQSLLFASPTYPDGIHLDDLPGA
jgi:hypothetical protein